MARRITPSMRPLLLLPLLLLLCFHSLLSVTTAASTSTSASASTSSSSTFRATTLPRPDFVSHVDRAALEQALATAQKRHAQAVRQALDNYQTDKALPPSARQLAELDKIHLDRYTIDCPGALPDFATELDRTVLVTSRSTPLLSVTECSQVIQDAEAYFAETDAGQWSTQQSGQYRVAGFWIRDIPAVNAWFVATVKQRLFVLLKKAFPDFMESPDDLCVDNAYLFKYTTETGRRTDVHTDSGCLSFTIALNGEEDYEGGGTWFEGIQKEDGSSIVEMNAGQITVRPGGVKHCGHAVTKGTRYIIGGFCMHRNKVETVRQLLTPTTSTAAAPINNKANLEAAVALNPACDAAYNLLANDYLQAGEKVKAQQVFEYCLQHVHAKSGDIAYSLGSLYLEQDLHQKAKECMETCLQADDCDMDAMMALAQACSGMGDAAGEEACYQSVIQTDTAAPKVIASAYCNLGVLHQGQPEEVEYYRKSLECVPDNFEPQFSLACAYASQQQWPEAVQAFRTAIDLTADKEFSVKALQALYKASMNLIRSDSSQPATREAMMARFHEVMGLDNYSRLAAVASQ